MITSKKLYLNKNLQILFSVTTIVVMGVTSIAPAFPKISKELGISIGSTGLLITVFTFPGIFLSPILGILADRIGRKKIIAPSLFLFGFAGAACAFTKDFQLLLLFRFVQGLGAASIGSLNLTIIGDIFTGKERIEAMGYNATVLSLSAAIYPALGGAIATIGWNYPFLLALLAIPIGLLVLFVLDNPEPQNNQHIKIYFKNIFKFLKNKQVGILFIATLATFILLYGVFFSYFTFFLENNFNASPFTIGMLISCASLGTLIGAANLRKFSNIFSSGKLISISFILFAISFFITPFVKNFYLMLIPVLIYGLANGICIPSTQTLIAGLAPMEYRGVFMSLNSMILRTGQTIGPILSGIPYALWGIQGVFYSTAIFSLFIFILLFSGLKD